jgi:predicted unusual protein kinase regulating ubiquinone biosynthesis (AarF/ABC1/UbiB family)
MSDSPQNPSSGQSWIPTNQFLRGAVLAGTGAQVGLNYLKYYGKKAVTQKDDKETLHRDNAETVYKTFSNLKGGPLKVAQMLSIDQNLLPTAYAKTFAQAQYSAPPLSYPLVARTFRREFNQEPLEVFETFTREAVSGASIGQVHRATRGSHTFAVKVQYPGIAQSLKSDLAIVKPLALQVMGVKEKDVEPYFREVEERLLDETNYRLELKRSIELSKACSHLAHLRFPRYYPEFSGDRIITMDWVEGITLDKFAESDASQEMRDRIGQALWDFYHHQIHELKLFHADPHPGNFLVDGESLWAIDFGCTKQLDLDFYHKNFRFLDPRILEDQSLLISALEDLTVFLPTDSPDFRKEMLALIHPSIDLLARPFRCPEFDFGDTDFIKAIYALGEENSQNDLLRNTRGARGSAHSVYVNRAYFGLYSLLTRLRSRIRSTLPDWLQPSPLPS